MPATDRRVSSLASQTSGIDGKNALIGRVFHAGPRMTNIAMAFDQSSPRNPVGKLEKLMRRAANDDALAFESLFHELKPVISGFIAKRADAATCVDDLSQETLSRLWQLRKKYDLNASVKTFALGIALNVLREDRAARYRRADSLPDFALEQQVECDSADAAERMETREIVANAKNRLPESAVAAIELVYERELRPAECAEFLGCTEKAFRRRLEKARKRLAQLLQAHVVSLFD